MQDQLDILKYINSQSKNTPKMYIQNRKDIYYDRWDYIIDSELLSQFTEQARERLLLLSTKEFNIFKQIIDRTSLVYKVPPTRYVQTGEGDNAVTDKTYTDVVSQTKLNRVLKKVNTITNRDNHCLVQPVWNDNGELDYNIHTFDNVEVYYDHDGIDGIRAIKYYVGLTLPYYDVANEGTTTVTMSKDNTGRSKNPRSYRDFENYEKSILYVADDNKVIWIYTFKTDGNGTEYQDGEPKKSPYTLNGKYKFPFVLFSKSYNEDGYLCFTEGDDIIDATIATAIEMAHLNELMKYQSHIQGILKVSDTTKYGQKITMGAGNILLISSGDKNTQADDFIRIDMQSSYDKLWNTIKERIVMVLSQYGVSPQNFTMSGTPSSGYALKLSNIALLERRKDDIELYRDYEKSLFEVTRMVNNTHNTVKISEGEFFIDFGEITYDDSAQDEQAAWNFKFMNNLATPIDYIMEKNPDLDEAKARQRYFENVAFNNQAKGRTLSPIQVPTQATQQIQQAQETEQAQTQEEE